MRVVDGLDVEGAVDDARAVLGRGRVVGDAAGAGEVCEDRIAVGAEHGVATQGVIEGCVQAYGVVVLEPPCASVPGPLDHRQHRYPQPADAERLGQALPKPHSRVRARGTVRNFVYGP